MFPFQQRNYGMGAISMAATSGVSNVNVLIDQFSSVYVPSLTDSKKVNRTGNFYLDYYYKQIKTNYWNLLTAAQQNALTQKLLSYQERLRTLEAGGPDPHDTSAAANTTSAAGGMVVFDPDTGAATVVPVGGLPVPGQSGGATSASNFIDNTVNELKKPVDVFGKNIPTWAVYGLIGAAAAVVLPGLFGGKK